MRILLINPNTNAATTQAMVAIAAEAAGGAARIDGLTAPFGVPLITTPAELATAAQAVAELAEVVEADIADAVIVSAFGDPGLDALRDRLAIPVVGIAEAAMREAGRDGRSFAVVTTTPDLAESIAARAAAYGHAARFRGVFLTQGDVHALMTRPPELEDALRRACERAVTEGGAEAIVIGGGPLASAARSIRTTHGPDIVEPVPAAVRRVLAIPG